MVLLSFSMDTVALFLRVWLWMSVPMSVVVLLWATWMNYRIIPRHPGGVKLAIEGWEGQALPIGEGLPAGSGEIMREQRVSRGEEDEEVSVSRGGEVGVVQGGEERVSDRDEERGSRVGEEKVSRGEEERGDMGSRSEIYRGILWMKEKYEQYREQADRRYELLREELRRSEQRYQELVMSMLPGQGSAEQTAADKGSIDELEAQLRIERLKTAELVLKLQTNSQLLLQVYQELKVEGKELRIWEE